MKVVYLKELIEALEDREHQERVSEIKSALDQQYTRAIEHKAVAAFCSSTVQSLISGNPIFGTKPIEVKEEGGFVFNWASCPPDTDRPILLEFENFKTPLVGRFYRDEFGGETYYIEDDDKEASAVGLYVKGWYELPKPHSES